MTSIPNLHRRGEIFYWRARIPARFVNCTKRQHISFTLRTGDLSQAVAIARHLNKLRDELDEPAMNEESLETIFQQEAEGMRLTMSKAVQASRRMGTAADPAHLIADLEVGWANTLLALFGTGKHLSLEQDCPGRAYLLKQGVPEKRLRGIALTLEAERRMWRSRGAEVEAAQVLADHGIENSAIGREAIVGARLRARGSVLLDYEGRYPLIDPAILATTPDLFDSDPVVSPSLANGEEASPAVRDVIPRDEDTVRDLADSQFQTATSRVAAEAPVLDMADAAAELPVDGGNAGDTGTAALRPALKASTSLPQPGAMATSTPRPPAQPAPTEALAEVDPGYVLRVTDFRKEFETLTTNKADAWSGSSPGQALNAVEFLEAILIEHGVKHSGEIEQRHLAAVRHLFNEIDENWGRSRRGPKTVLDLDFMRMRGERALQLRGKKGLSSLTVRKHLTNLDTFLTHIRASGYELSEKLSTGGPLRPKKPSKEAAKRKSEKPAAELVQKTLMQLPIFSGCAGPGLPCFPTVPKSQRLYVSGDQFYHCGTTLAPLALHYSAARRDEICNLDCEDIAYSGSIPVMHIRFSESKRVKTDQTERVLPIPDELLRLRFMEYVDRIRELGFTKVFPDLFKPYSNTPPGNTLYDNLTTIIERSPAEFGGSQKKYWKRLIHALRHGTNNTLFNLRVPEEFRNELTGHAQTGTNSVVYRDEAHVEWLREPMRMVPVITSHMEVRPLRLLPVVEKRDMSLWRKPKEPWNGFVNPVWQPFYKG